MAYSPPAVTTSVQIANNIVQLPGGTRVLALIGLGLTTLSTTAESVTQQSNYISLPLDDSTNGVTSIQSIYDFTGPGGSQVVYSPSGQGPFGEGYYIATTGIGGVIYTGSVGWSPSANPYPSSTTPTIGSQYYVTFTGSFAGTGTHVLETELLHRPAITTFCCLHILEFLLLLFLVSQQVLSIPLRAQYQDLTPTDMELLIADTHYLQVVRLFGRSAIGRLWIFICNYASNRK